MRGGGKPQDFGERLNKTKALVVLQAFEMRNKGKSTRDRDETKQRTTGGGEGKYPGGVREKQGEERRYLTD